jgi:hypothetical protein
MSAISAMLSQHEPWRQSALPPDQRCCDTNASTFGLNDHKSRTTAAKPRIVENSIGETANFSNNRVLPIHCFHIGELAAAIPPRDAGGAPIDTPSQCDEVLYSDGREFILLAEIKVTDKNGAKIAQLKKTLDHLFAIPAAAGFIKTFASKKCCFFRKTPPSALLPSRIITAASAFASSPRRSGGNKISNRQLTQNFEKSGFELWSFSDGDVCTLT